MIMHPFPCVGNNQAVSDEKHNTMCALSSRDQPNARLPFPDNWCLSSVSDAQQHASQSVLTSGYRAEF